MGKGDEFFKNDKRALELWNQLLIDLKYQNRFFVKNDLIDEIRRILPGYEEIIPADSEFYRARIYNDIHNGNDLNSRKPPFRGYDAENSFVNKNYDSIDNGRVNPQYISYLYMAKSVYTACVEVRPLIRDYVSVAKIINSESLKVINFSDIDQSLFVSNFDERIVQLLVNAYSKPTNNKADYLITQFLSELIKSEGYDGIVFHSSLDKEGINVTIFNYTKCIAVESDLYNVMDFKLDVKIANEDKKENKDLSETDENNKDTLIVKDKDGKEKEVEVLTIFKQEKTGIDYIFYIDPDDSKEEYPSGESLINMSKLIDRENQYILEGLNGEETALCKNVMKEIYKHMDSLSEADPDFNTALPEGFIFDIPERLKHATEVNDAPKNSRFTVIGDDGNEMECEVLFTFDSEETKKHYIIYTDNTEDEEGNTKVYASTFDPDSDKAALVPIETEHEWKIIQIIMDSLDKEQNKQN